jgi:hypothetical protein
MRKSWVLILVLTLAACVTGQSFANLSEGMTKEQVVAAVGNPDGFQRAGSYEAMKYTNLYVSGWKWDRADYYVILKDGRVTAYGPGQVRQSDGPGGIAMLMLVPVRAP